MFKNSIFLAGALGLIAGSHAHMIMNTPVPYGASTVTTSPINNVNGIDFPCQMGNRADAVEADGASNPMVVGQDNDLKFTGSATHGGGSCQLSVTYDSPPPADKSKWKVIHSFVGSCPSNTTGNLDEAHLDAYQRPTAEQCDYDDEPNCLKVFQFQIPEGMKNGNATLAWTWFNNVGNREMYMNCAPISISGGSDDDTFFNSLPEMFVANVPGSDQSTCVTGKSDGSGGVIGFPNPGDYVTYGEAITPNAQGNCSAAASSNSSSSSDSSSSAAVSSYAASTSNAAASSASTSITLSAVQAGKTSTTTKSETSTVESTTLLTMTGYATSTATASSAYATAAATGSSTSSGNSTCTNDKVSCSTPGDLICIGDSDFGICNIDYCAVPEALSAGTTCSGGVVSKRDVVRRSHRHAAGHLRKRNF